MLNCQGQLANPMRAELRSDLGLVRPAGAATWTEFRDVFESNGAPVRDRTERLTRLFLGDAVDSRAQIGRILAESSRFNIGDISRNVNTPLFPLQFLERRNQPRFAFKRAGKGTPATFTGGETPTAAFRVSVDVWIVEYEEKQAGTMIRTHGLKDLPSRGRFWIDPDTGRVLMSELVARNRDLHATIDVSYQSEPLLGCLVPIEMREDYQNRRARTSPAPPPMAGSGSFRSTSTRNSSRWSSDDAAIRAFACGVLTVIAVAAPVGGAGTDARDRSPARRRLRRDWSSAACRALSRRNATASNGPCCRAGWSTDEQRHRELVSDLLIVKLETAGSPGAVPRRLRRRWRAGAGSRRAADEAVSAADRDRRPISSNES